MHDSLRPWLPALLPCCPLVTHAGTATGDFSMAHHQGSLFKPGISLIEGEPENLYTGPENGRLVHSKYRGDLVHSASRVIRVTLHRARQLDDLLVRGNRGGIALQPKA